MEQKQLSYGPVYDRIPPPPPPPLSPKYQWFVAQNEDGKGDDFFYNIHDPLSFYRCRIPELHNRRIRGSFHGWLILSNDNMWSLWNPVTSKIVRLPPLVLTDGDSTYIKECCLSLPPDDPKSILLLTRTDKPNFVFCLLNPRRKRLKWIEMSYAKQLKRTSGENALLVRSLCCCNGEVYALSTDNKMNDLVIKIGIVVKDGGVVIKLMLFSGCPVIPFPRAHEFIFFLIGSNAELFCIIIGFEFRVIEDTRFTFVSLNKVDMTSLNWGLLEGLKNWDISGKTAADMEEEELHNMWNSSDIWEHMKDLKDGDFFLDLARDNSVAYSYMIASEFGGNIHIRSRMRKFIYSHNVSDRTIMLSSMFPSPLLPTSHVSVWGCRLAADYAKPKQEVENKDRGIVVRLVDDDDVELDESRLLNLPHGVFEMIMEFCIGLEYLNFRATCKRCHLAAPVVQWGDEVALKRLQNYSLLSPWLMMADEKRGIVTFEDPLYGYKYFMKKLSPPAADGEKCYSVYGWLLYHSERGLEFCNPFTNEVHHLPETDDFLDRLCFSAPPTSPDCMVVGFGTEGIYIHFVHGEQTWRLVGRNGNLLASMDNDNDNDNDDEDDDDEDDNDDKDDDKDDDEDDNDDDDNDDEDDDDNDDDDDYEDCLTFYYPTFCGRDVYALSAKGKLYEGKIYIFKNMGQEDYSFKHDIVEAPRSCARLYPVEYFLTKCDQHVLLVFVDHFGESIEVFRLNDLTKEWEKTNGLGRRTIYISDDACICVEAKTREMEDKIFFARFYNKNGKVVFYSFETGMYHTFNDKNIEESFGDFVGTKHPLFPNAWIEPTWGAIKTSAV